MNKKVLVLGGTGAMGTYLVPKLVEDGYTVDVAAIDNESPFDSAVNYFKADAKDMAVVSEIVKNHYDAVIDFMIYNTKTFPDFASVYLDNTDQYIYLSTYRVYADEEHPIREASPRLLDVSEDPQLLASDDYCIYKANGENLLRSKEKKNWTIIRPAITFSKKRCQLLIHEREHLLPYIRQGKPVPLFSEALSFQATMSWAGDVAEMERRLLFNDRALGEDFNVTTSEHHSWGEIADYYSDLFSLKYVLSDENTYLAGRGDINVDYCPAAKYQLHYDRMFNRDMDNTKILEYTRMKQSELTSLYDGLKRERETILND